MFEPEIISTNVRRQAAFARICGFIMVAAFLFSQTFSSAHAHEYSEEGPLHQSCEVCILAINDDGDVDNVTDQNIDAEDTISFWVQIDRLALAEAGPVPSISYAARSIDPPPEPSLRQDSARAPPFYI